MRSVKFKGLILFVLMSHLFSTNLAWACSPVEYRDVEGRCTPDDEKQLLMVYQHANLHTRLNQFAVQCGVEGQVTAEQLDEILMEWSRWSNLVFEPYSENREQELKINEQILHRCFYEKGFRVGNWLAITDVFREELAKRNYCGGSFPAICSLDNVHFVAFLHYLITQPSPAAISYLVLFVLFTTLGTTLFYQLLTRKLIKLGCLVNLLIVTPFTLCLSFFIWPQTVQLAGWVLSCYLLAYGWYAFNHLKKKNKELSQITLLK